MESAETRATDVITLRLRVRTGEDRSVLAPRQQHELVVLGVGERPLT